MVMVHGKILIHVGVDRLQHFGVAMSSKQQFLYLGLSLLFRVVVWFKKLHPMSLIFLFLTNLFGISFSCVFVRSLFEWVIMYTNNQYLLKKLCADFTPICPCRFASAVNSTISSLHPIHCTRERKVDVELDLTTIPAFLVVFAVLWFVLRPRRPKPKIN